jgi:predicted DNA-binding protein with PD1-like motif
LEDGEVLHEVVERFARDRKIEAAALIAVGAADKDSALVVGPAKRNQRPVNPMVRLLEDAGEIAGVGTLFPNEKGEPILHMHAAVGREGKTTTGCVRKGVRIWQVLEVVVFELRNVDAVRKLNPELGFELLEPGKVRGPTG